MYRNALAIQYRNRSLVATGEGEKMFMTLLQVSIGGGLVAFSGAVIAQVDPNGSAGQTGFWLGASGIVASVVAALGAVAKQFWDDRQRARESEITKLRIMLGNDRNKREVVKNREYLGELRDAIQKIPGCPPLPEPPDFGGDFHAPLLEPGDD